MDTATQEDASPEAPANQLALAMAAVDDFDEQACTCPWTNVMHRLACRCCLRTTCVAIVLHFMVKWDSDVWPLLKLALPLTKLVVCFALLVAVFLFPYADSCPFTLGQAC